MLPVLGKKAVLEWCMKEGLFGSSYVCPKCGKSMELRERMVTEIHHRKNLLCGPMSTKGIQAMIKRFEETGKLGVQTGRGHKHDKHATPVLVDGIKTAVDAHTLEFGGVACMQFLKRGQAIFTAQFKRSTFSKQQMPVCEVYMANAKTSQFDISSSQWHHRPCSYDRFHRVQFVIQLRTP
ncbi:hypothetical protein TNCV_3202341 [Trichonephila clavipes]|nr:hypothetical protein TNCV_3202341 [Trichonephila clavipes]